ncbi:MAG TPA: UDP-galactopyranose mutase [Clostridia bacterium]|nr:UDP-galactopyranose mutase [Clostridia bacterium]
MKQYDFLIVGAGLFGSVFAREMTDKGKKCLVIDKRSTTGGNLRCENTENINVHKYGAHIFHTDDAEVWNYVNRFAEFNRYTNSPIACYKGKIYNLPFNMNTFYQMWGVITPEDAKNRIAEQVAKENIVNPKNLEEKALSLVGRDIYEKLIKGYTEKQWGCSAKELPEFIINRLPLRFTYDNNYFNSRFQGIPIGGYNVLIDELLDGIEVWLNEDYIAKRDFYNSLADKVLYTGELDRYFGYSLGNLEYRSLRFEEEILDTENFQGNAVVNYTEREVPFTRIIEHKHFENAVSPKTVITREYPKTWEKGDEPYYPVNNKENDELYAKYRALAEKEENLIIGGRLGLYKYYDMDKIVRLALDLSRS